MTERPVRRHHAPNRLLPQMHVIPPNLGEKHQAKGTKKRGVKDDSGPPDVLPRSRGRVVFAPQVWSAAGRRAVLPSLSLLGCFSFASPSRRAAGAFSSPCPCLPYQSYYQQRSLRICGAKAASFRPSLICTGTETAGDAADTHQNSLLHWCKALFALARALQLMQHLPLFPPWVLGRRFAPRPALASRAVPLKREL